VRQLRLRERGGSGEARRIGFGRRDGEVVWGGSGVAVGVVRRSRLRAVATAQGLQRYRYYLRLLWFDSHGIDCERRHGGCSSLGADRGRQSLPLELSSYPRERSGGTVPDEFHPLPPPDGCSIRCHHVRCDFSPTTSNIASRMLYNIALRAVLRNSFLLFNSLHISSLSSREIYIKRIAALLFSRSVLLHLD
jgi:hypothetical protein